MSLLKDSLEWIRGSLNQMPRPNQAKNDLINPILRKSFRQLDVVSREEFETQRRVLSRTRELLHTLEARLDALESDPNSTTEI